MAENFNPITGLDGADNMGGYKNRVLWIPEYAVTTVPKIPALSAVADNDDYVTASGSFTFKEATGKPIVFICTDKTVKYDAPSQGEIEGKSFAPAGEFFRAGAKAEYAAAARKFNNSPGYLVLEDMDGKQLLVGQPGLPCNLSAEFTGGQARADRRGVKFSFSADSVAPYIYLETKIDIDTLLED